MKSSQQSQSCRCAPLPRTYAAGPGPSVSISGYSGNIHGTVSSVSTGSSVVSTQVNGYGSSSQTSFGETGGVAQASGRSATTASKPSPARGNTPPAIPTAT